MTPSIPPVDPTVASAVVDTPADSDSQPSPSAEPTKTEPASEPPVSDAVVTPTVPSDNAEPVGRNSYSMTIYGTIMKQNAVKECLNLNYCS